MARTSDGSWSSGQLWPPPKLSEHPADMTIENAVLECADPSRQPASLITFRELNLTIKHQHLPHAVPLADGTLQPSERHLMQVSGSLTGDHLRRIVFEGELEPEAQSVGVGGTVDGLDFSPFLASLPADVAQQLAPLSALRAQAGIEFRLAYDPAAAPPLKFQTTSHVSQGRIDDPRLPFPLEDLQATVHANNGGVVIEKLVARNGQTLLTLSGCRNGYAANSPMQLALVGKRMTLDRRLFETLPEQCQQIWPKFFPAGEVDVDARLTFDGTVWRPEFTIDCLNVSFLYHDFPYRLERATGWLKLKDDTLTTSLTAFAGSDEVTIAGEFVRPGPNFTGKVTVEPVRARFDDRLFAALKEPSRSVLRSLHPSGAFHCRFTCWRKPDETTVHKHVLGKFNGCSLRYEKFPYPLDNISGRFEMTDGRWSFIDLVGANDTGIVRCDGHLVPLAQGSELVLNFQADCVPLDEELREALDARGCRTWDLLRPRGAIDIRDCTVRYLSAMKGVDLHLRLLPHGEHTSIHPVPFPYLLDKLRGEVVYRNGHVEFENLRGEHGRTLILAKGSSACLPDAWHLRFDKLVVDRLQADRDLLVALPERLRKAVLAMNPTGQMNLDGGLNFYGAAGSPHPEASWDAEIQFRGGTLDAGVLLENLEGSLRLVGGFDGQHAQSWGELNFDSVTWKDFQFTDIAGPLWIDDTRVILGAARNRRARRPAARPACSAAGPSAPTAGWRWDLRRSIGCRLLSSRPTWRDSRKKWWPASRRSAARWRPISTSAVKAAACTPSAGAAASRSATPTFMSYP